MKVKTMTLVNTHYNFMSLLRDNGQIPAQAKTEMGVVWYMNLLINEFKLNVAAAKTTVETDHYDFMDLLRDNGFIPTPSNDNKPATLKAA